MLQRNLVLAAAWLEIIAGAAFLIILDVVCQLLFATKPDGLGIITGRLSGIGLLALGITCLLSKMDGSQHTAALGLFLFNSGIALLLGWTAIATTFRGVLLWPVTVLHGVIAIGLLLQLLTLKNVPYSEKGHVSKPAFQPYAREGGK